MKAKGRDGQWREYADLTPEEQREWMEAMTKAAQVVEERRSGMCAPTLAQNLARHELNKRFLY